jgi:hypothetical protein
MPSASPRARSNRSLIVLVNDTAVDAAARTYIST